MGATTKIEWTDSTWNWCYCCSKVSPGCDICYAERWAKRAGKPWGRPIIASQRTFESPLRWKGPCRIFPCSLSDSFHADIPYTWRAYAWDIIARTPQHRYLMLTKRPENIPDRLPPDWAQNFGHVWLGVTVENADYLHRIETLINAARASRFLSLEPLLGPLPKLDLRWIDWVIVGGETGPGARPMEADWARKVRDECQAAGVSFFMKQLSRRQPIPADLQIREIPKGLELDHASPNST